MVAVITDWKQELRESFSEPAALLEFVELTAQQLDYSSHMLQTFPVRVPQGFARRIKKQDPHDPLLRQIFPLGAESIQHNAFTNDPLAEQSQQVVPGILHKYQRRALLIATASCAVHCRYCFRKHFAYPKASIDQPGWQAALDYLHSHTDLNEIIVSGGDPLMLSDHKLQSLLQTLATIPHLKRLRIHTRMPVVLPSRITPELTTLITATRLRVVVVIHVNHANELCSDTAVALQLLTAKHIRLLNQSVLLRGVNDNVDSLIALSEQLFDQTVLPYYLHLLDRVTGTKHYEVTSTQAKHLMHQIRTKLPGYLVPKLVTEQPGAAYKKLLL